MAKFKVGDKVKRVSGSYHLGISEGDVCAVTAVNPEHGWLSVDNIVNDLDKYPFNPRCFELVEEKTMSLQDNIDRMKQELAAMEAQLQEEQKRSAYIGDRKVQVELTLDELGYLVSIMGEKPRGSYLRNEVKVLGTSVGNALHQNRVKTFDTMGLFIKMNDKFKEML